MSHRQIFSTSLSILFSFLIFILFVSRADAASTTTDPFPLPTLPTPPSIPPIEPIEPAPAVSTTVSTGGSGGGGGGGGSGGGSPSVIQSIAPDLNQTLTATVLPAIEAVRQIPVKTNPLTANILSALSPTTNTKTSSIYKFTKNFRLHDAHPEIKNLQKYLNTHGYKIATSGPGSPGNETEKFGNFTLTALKKFQKANGLLGTGLFGPKTRGLMAK